MFEFLRRLFGKAPPADDTAQWSAPQDRQAAAELAAAGMQVPAEPPVPVSPARYEPRKGAYDRRPTKPPPRATG